jgi:hypothetical protein
MEGLIGAVKIQVRWRTGELKEPLKSLAIVVLPTNLQHGTVMVVVTIMQPAGGGRMVRAGNVGLVPAKAKCVINFNNPLWRLKYIMLESNNKKKKILA